MSSNCSVNGCLSNRSWDYVPVLSTVTSLVHLFTKVVILPRKEEAEIENNHYYTHLKDRSFLRCITLLIPVLGNFLVYRWDKYRDSLLDYINNYDPQHHGGEAYTFKGASILWGNDKEIALAAAKKDPYNLVYVNKTLKDEIDLEVLKDGQGGYLALQYVSKERKKELALEVFRYAGSSKCRRAYDLLSEELKKDPDICKAFETSAKNPSPQGKRSSSVFNFQKRCEQ